MSNYATQTNYAVQLNRANGQNDIVQEWVTRERATKMAVRAIMMVRKQPPPERILSISVVDFDGNPVETLTV